MKKSLSIVLLGIAVAVMAHVSAISWKTTNLELGKVKTNEVMALSFELTNSGNEPVRILEAKGSCGCTVVDFPKQDILPGKSATIEATFKSSKLGVFKKSIQVKTTASEVYTDLQFSGEVVE